MSLYRKYRPQTFEDVVGQEHVARTLRNALTSDPPRVAHAYLFTGPRGIGKTTNARLLAKCLNCEQGPTPTPCNACDFCTRVAANQPVMDLIEIDAASHTGVDNIRETIIDKVGTAPAQGRFRVYVIDECHMLSTSAFNALLKTLEEPPPHAVFILATTDSHKVPTTITSRCQRFDFRRVTPPDIARRLRHVAESENWNLSDEAARLIARHADGALRDALTLLEQVSAFSGEEITASDVRLVLGGVPQELLDGLVAGVIEHDPHAVLGLLERAVDEGASFSQLCRDLTAYTRDLMLLTVGFAGDETLSAPEKATRQSHAQQLGRARIEQVLALLRESEKEMRQSTDHRLLLELALVKACSESIPLAAASPTIVSAPAPAGTAPTAWRRAAPANRERSASPPDVSPTGRAVEAESTRPQEPTPRPERDEVANPVSADDSSDKGVAINRIAEKESHAPELDSEPPMPDEPEAFTEPPVEESEAETVDSSEMASAPVPEEVPEEMPDEAASKSRKKGRRISSFEELVELWPAVLMRIRKRVGITAVAYLHDARPIGFTDDEVILEFTKEFHHAKATEAMKRLPFEEKINETLDRPRRLRLHLAAPAPRQSDAAGDAEMPTDDDDEDDFDGDIVSYAQHIFAADIVGRSG